MDTSVTDQEIYNTVFNDSTRTISRLMNPFSNKFEWCVASIDCEGNLQPIAFGSTIPDAIKNAYAMMRGE
jgi:hypothetical protein